MDLGQLHLDATLLKRHHLPFDADQICLGQLIKHELQTKIGNVFLKLKCKPLFMEIYSNLNQTLAESERDFISQN